MTRYSSFLYAFFLAFVFIGSSQNLDAQTALLDKKQSTTCLDRSFSIMAHIVRDSLGDIHSSAQDLYDGIELVNLWFEPICVRFHIAQIDTIDNFQYYFPESLNEVQQIWNNHNADHRINLYAIGSLANIGLEPVLATFEGITIPSDGGILASEEVINEDPLWLVHAFGHYCGLLNTNNQIGAELVDGSNCATTGDEICDTPADPHNPEAPARGLGIYYNESCSFIYTTKDPNDEYYIAQTGNAMSNYPVECWCGLTYGQFERMASVIASSELWR